MTTAPNVPARGLTSAQLEARNKGIGGSDAKRIMDGDLMTLWLEKTGRQPPEDLTWELHVQMGHTTEALNALWFEHETGLAVNCSPALKESTLYHPAYKFMLCHPDGLVIEDGVVKLFDAKHTNPFEPADAIVGRSFAQFQHNMECGDLPEGFLSAFYGNMKYGYFRIKTPITSASCWTARSSSGGASRRTRRPRASRRSRRRRSRP